MILNKKISIYLILVFFSSVLFGSTNDKQKKHIENTTSIPKQFLHEKNNSNVIASNSIEERIYELTHSFPPLNNNLSFSMVGLIGKMLDYHTSLYNAAMAALKGGSDICYLVYVDVPKKYPELPMEWLFLPMPEDLEEFSPFISKLNQMTSIVIGMDIRNVEYYGEVRNTTIKMIQTIQTKRKPIILDEDGVGMLITEKNLFQNYTGTIYFNLHSKDLKILISAYDNVTTFNSEDNGALQQLVGIINPNAILVLKDEHITDRIITADKTYFCSFSKSSSKCPSQGPIISGLLGLFSYYAGLHKKKKKSEIPPEIAACYIALSISNLCCKRIKKLLAEHNFLPELVSELQLARMEYFNSTSILE